MMKEFKYKVSESLFTYIITSKEFEEINKELNLPITQENYQFFSVIYKGKDAVIEKIPKEMSDSMALNTNLADIDVNSTIEARKSFDFDKLAEESDLVTAEDIDIDEFGMEDFDFDKDEIEYAFRKLGNIKNEALNRHRNNVRTSIIDCKDLLKYNPNTLKEELESFKKFPKKIAISQDKNYIEKEYEEKTGKKAIWGKKYTKIFKKWVLDNGYGGVYSW